MKFALALAMLLALLLLGCPGADTGNALNYTTPAPQPTPEQADNFTLHVVYFFGATCQYSAKSTPLVDELMLQYGNRKVIFHKYEVWYDADNKLLYDRMADAYGIKESNRGVPVVFIDGEYLMGYQRINGYLEGEIKSCREAKCPNPLDAPSNPGIAKPI